MSIIKPPPLTLVPTQPKDLLKQMLEETERKENDPKYQSPLDEIDPEALDELMNRINNEFLLNQIPSMKDVPKLAEYYQSLLVRFNYELQTGLKTKQTRTKTKKPQINSVDLLIDEDDEEE